MTMLLDLRDLLFKHPDEVHMHKCGFGKPYDKSGCGHVWAHAPADIVETEEAFAEGHNCPACGAGPWFGKFCRSNVERDAAERQKRREAA